MTRLTAGTKIRWQGGVTLVELMVGMSIGLLLIALTASAYIAQSQTTRATDESSRLQETARVAMNALERTIRLAGFSAYGEGTSPPNFCAASATTVDDASSNPPVLGPFVEGRVGGGHLANSDRLILRFYGAGAGTGDASIRDCRGVSVPGQPSNNTVNTFYVANDPDGEPALFCSARVPFSAAASTRQALIPGVESLQVIYAVTDGTSSEPRQYLTADKVTDWRRVVAVRISLMIRGDIGSRASVDNGPSATQTYYDMFDADFTGRAGSVDVGAKFTPSTVLSASERLRLRRVFSSVIELRNSPATTCSP